MSLFKKTMSIDEVFVMSLFGRNLNLARFCAKVAAVAVMMTCILAVATAQERYVESPARTIPIIDSVDVVVVGGGDGGMAAAWKAAKTGARVILLNENTFFSSDVTAKGRFKLGGAAPSQEFSRRLYADMTPAAYRLAAETLLREAGVVYISNTRPAGVLVDGAGKLAGVVTANKAGLQAVVAKVVIDATYTGAVADAAGAERTPWGVSKLEVSRARFTKKVKSLNEIVKTVAMPTLSWPLINKAESLLREEDRRAIGDAYAYCLHFTMPNAIVAKASAAAFSGAGALDLGVCEPRNVERLLVIGSSCAVGRETVRALMDPVALAEVGERLGERAVALAKGAAAPAGVAVKAPGAAGRAAAGLAISELNERERPFKRAPLQTVAQPAIGVPVWAEYDVIVVGSGPAGHSAAIAAGRGGAKVLMIEQGGFIGGNVALGVTGFWRGYRKGFNQEWTNAKYPLMLKDAGVDIWYNSLAMGAVKRGNQVAGVEVATWMGRGVALAKIVIDASGDGDVCAAAGAQAMYLSNGDLCLEEASFKDIGLYTNVAPYDPMDVAGATTHHAMAMQAGKLTWDFRPMVQIRETRLIKGDVVVNELDVDAGRTWHDVIAIAGSAFDPHGYYGSDYSFAGLMPSTKHVKADVISYIPLRAIVPAGIENMMMVGRCHSTTHDAQAMIRMNPDVINEGYAAGRAAAMCVKDGTTPRNVNLKALQDHLFSIGNLPAEERERITTDLPEPSDAKLAKAAADPGAREALLALARGGARAQAPLRQSFAELPTPAKARALCLLGDAAGVEHLAAWVDAQPLGTGPAYDWEGFLDVPEIDGAIWLLGIPKDRRAVPALVKKLAECKADTGFNKLRAVTMALGRIGDPGAAGALAAFLKQPGVQGHMNRGDDPSTIKANKFAPAMIELFAASALVRCGDAEGGLGRKILTGYLDDWRGVFVRFAGQVLEEKRLAVKP